MEKYNIFLEVFCGVISIAKNSISSIIASFISNKFNDIDNIYNKNDFRLRLVKTQSVYKIANYSNKVNHSAELWAGNLHVWFCGGGVVNWITPLGHSIW